ncbi:hypothetical protein [Agromyces sp. SYSU T00266]|uniref:hypothetical protein n=1 Tax=Agromyces zhanjiangensis TaxID=3158562 RepID=UPI0033907F2C
MQPYSDEWLNRLADGISIYPVPSVQLDELVDIAALGLDELSFGYRIGVVDARTAIDVSLSRFQAGIAQERAQERLALMLSDELELATGILATRDLTDIGGGVEDMWLYCVLRLYLERWRESRRSDVRYELGEILAYWTPRATAPWDRILDRARTVFKPHSRAAVLDAVRKQLETGSARYVRPST